jgi:hypothetical protein
MGWWKDERAHLSLKDAIAIEALLTVLGFDQEVLHS